MEREEGSLGRTLERKGTGMSTACPPKYHFYTSPIHHHKPHLPEANTHTGLHLSNFKPKIQARYFWVQSPASGETKGCETADSMSGVQSRGHPTRLEVPHPMLKADLCPLSEARQFESEAFGNQPLLSGHVLGVPPSPSPSLDVWPGAAGGIRRCSGAL